jgi:hypothetical protein
MSSIPRRVVGSVRVFHVWAENGGMPAALRVIELDSIRGICLHPLRERRLMKLIFPFRRFLCPKFPK